MTTIWKFALPNTQRLTLPDDAKPLCVQMQNGEPHVWVQLNPDPGAWHVERRLVVVGTGHPVPADLAYVGTWQEGAFVWHLYFG